MLAAVSHSYEPHYTQKNSLKALTASLNDGKTHLLLACSGSVATIKLPSMIQALSKYPPNKLSIRVVLTPSATQFLAGQSQEQPTVSGLYELPNVDAVEGRHAHIQQYMDADEWKVPWVRGGGILHIELRRWADLLVIAPLSANTLAKIVGGFADSLLTSVVRAWDPWGELDAAPALTTTEEGTGAVINRRSKKRRILVAPAMNTAMWRHPITAKQLRVLEKEWGVANPEDLKDGASPDEGDGWFEVLRPQPKVLVCGDAGDGAMMEWSQIVAVIEERLGFLA